MPDPVVLCDAKHIRLMRKEGWEYATRKSISGIVGVVAVTDDGRLLLAEQYRPPVGRNVIEIPAGLAGDAAGREQEDLSVAAARELLEETGYEAQRMELLCAGTSSAGITDELITLYRGRGLRKVGAPVGDGSEQITPHEISLDVVAHWLAERAAEGRLIDLKVYAALYFAMRP